jgi:glycosyltransferase involved in cell wall biosynthesis
MACGLPTVITDVGGANEMIINGVNGYLSEVNEISIAENWLKALTTNFYPDDIIANVSSKYDLKVMIDKYNSVFNNIK